VSRRKTPEKPRKRNPVATDLGTPKYHQRVSEGKRPFIDDYDWESEVDEYYYPEDEEPIIDFEE
jgi:hypothetical protein